MHACNCGKARRALAVTKWALPATVLALVPKCPACVAAYVLLATGVGVSVSTAAVIRTGVIAVSVGTLLMLLAGAAVSRRGRSAARR